MEPIFRIDPRARRISLSVCPARRSLVLTAPSARARRAAFAFLDSRSVWARGELARLPQAMPFRPGGPILLRGARIMLLGAPGRGPAMLGDTGDLLVPGREDAFAGRVRRFLRTQAEADFAAALARHCATLNRPVPPFRLRDTRSRWGSCTAEGTINLSWRLVCAPPFVLDHVAAHEAAHLAHMNHGARFRALERRLSPRCDEAGAWLAEHGPLLHAIGAEA